MRYNINTDSFPSWNEDEMYNREQLIQYDYFKKVLNGHRISDVLDGLTGLVSKVHMLSFTESLIEAGIPFTFGMIDLDNFKYINDTYGHSVGDGILSAFSESLQNYLSDFGIAGRFGGDEFLFINFRDLTYDENKRFCQQLFGSFQILRRTIKVSDYEIFITGTAGLAGFPKDAENYEDLFGLIDKVLYRGKSKGRNCYIIYVEEKHKNIEIIRLKKNTLYDTFKNLTAGFDASENFYEKLKAGYEALKNDLNITNLFFAGNNKELISVLDRHFLGTIDDIEQLMDEEVYSTNQIENIRQNSLHLYKILSENEIESVLIMKINIEGRNYGYLMCAEPHTLRIWQENEYAILFLFARMAGQYMQSSLTGQG